jgi:Penicillin-insensitive murein endopeptidase
MSLRMARTLIITGLVAVGVTVTLAVRPIWLGDHGAGTEASPTASPVAPGRANRADDTRARTDATARAGERGGGETDGRDERIRWRRSVAVGLPEAGSLLRGVRLPAEGGHYFTWDPIERRQPNRGWRRWGTDDLVGSTLHVIRAYARAHPSAPRVGIGDLSRPHGGDFGPRFGGIGHATHQNGLDADVYYPLRGGGERAPLSVDEIDLRLAQELVDRFVAAGAVRVYVGPNTGLTGPPEIVQAIPNHDDHLHVRIAG